MGNVHMEATQINYREGDKKMSVAQAIKNAGNTGLAHTADIAPDFSAESVYNAGDLVYHNGTLYVFTANHAAGAWSTEDTQAVTVGGELTSLMSGLIDQTAGNTFRIDTAKMPLYYDGASYSGYVPFPFVTKNTNYTVTLLDVAQNNVGSVTENATVEIKKNVGFSFSIAGTYDSTKCGASIICEITFA